MLRVVFRRSRQMAIALTLMHGAAIVCWLLLPIPLWGHFAGVLFLSASLAWSLARHAWLMIRNSVIGILGDAEGGAQIEFRDGAVSDARILGDSFVTPGLTVIRLKLANGKRTTVLVMPDKAMPEPYRQLRVWLKWRAGKGNTGDANGGWATRV